MGSTGESLPADCGQRLLPHVVDDLAEDDPHRVFLSYPRGSQPKDGYRDITYAEFAAGINNCSWWLDQKLGRSRNFKTLFYLGSVDLLSTVVLYSAVKTGHKLFLIQGYQTVDDVIKMLDDLDCDTMLLTAEGGSPLVKDCLSKRTMRTLVLPSLNDHLVATKGQPYPYEKTFSQAKHDPFVVLHTSGSTGRPKPVSLTHGTVAHHDLFLHASLLGGKPLNLARFSGKRVLLGLPFFHSAVVCFLAFSVYSNTTPVVLPAQPSIQESAAMANEAHLHARVDASFLPPSVLSEMVQHPDHLENLARLQYLTFGGSPLPRNLGDVLKGLTHLFLCFGTTECGYYALEETESEDWAYASFSPIMASELRPFSEGLSDFAFVRADDPLKSQGVFSTFPDLGEYPTKDLYSKHPQKEGLWHYESRTDDVLILSDGLRYFPQEVERNVSAHPAVTSCMVCGKGRLRPALLVELKDPPSTESERSSMLDEIWPLVESADHSVFNETHISKDLIIFTSKVKPVPRSGKGSVLRPKTEELYRPELDQAYGGSVHSF